MNLELKIYPEECLTKKSKEVTKFDQDLMDLAKLMHKKMLEWGGVGLAAPQVGCNIRLFVSKVHGRRITWVNPKVIWESEGLQRQYEGCLSIPDRSLAIKRPNDIIVEYQNLKGDYQQKSLTGLEAVCVLHEIEHLDGVLMLDYLDKDGTVEYNKNEE
jgi:peptide deformylase